MPGEQGEPRGIAALQRRSHPGRALLAFPDIQESAINIGLGRISVGVIVAAATVACSNLQQRDAGMSAKPDPHGDVVGTIAAQRLLV